MHEPGNRRVLAIAVILLALLAACGQQDRIQTAAPNDNRQPAGTLQDGVLRLDLEVRPGRWSPEGADGAALPVHLFAERGHPATVPGPLIRVPAGTEIRLRIHNVLSDSTVAIFGLAPRPDLEQDTLRLRPGAERELRFIAGAPGTYYYWGSTTGKGVEDREWLDSQLNGAFIVDSTDDTPDDRIFVLGIWSNLADSVPAAGPDTGEVMVINGLAWPHTERFQVPVGDTLRWRVVNPSSSSHPMHLHGVYFEVASRGDAARDTLYPVGRRPLEVTELMLPGGTMSMRWAPARPGNWIFHCHFAFHVSPGVSFDRRPEQHGHHRMAGLVLGITATGPERPSSPPAARALRLLVQQRPNRIRGGPGFGFVLQRDRVPAEDSVEIPGSPLLLTRGEPVAITVVNRLTEPTAIHWHGMELESAFDGVPDLSGIDPRLFRAIAPGDSFIARFTPPRAGTFIYHSHFDEVDQMPLGLYGPLLVLAPGQHFDPATDHLVIVGGNGPPTTPDSVPGLVNGARVPAPIVLAAGRPNRLRLISIDPDHRIVFTLLRDTTVARWRAVAKDGAELPPQLATERRAVLMTGPGETADFEVTPSGPGALALRIEAPFADVPWSITLPLPIR
jgi:FtsP/CotA-like multicopper oxidase with cupredoxin domain